MKIVSWVRLLFFFSLMFNSSCSSALDLPEAKITIKIINDSGILMVGEEVTVGFEVPEGFRQGIKSTIIKGFTNSEGAYTVNHETIGGVGFRIEKAGFYKSEGQYQFKMQNRGRWEPWNPEVMVLFRKIENPIPMYARDTQMSGLTIPVLGRAVGFDLIEYAWMPPYGNGKHSDMIFRVDKRIVNDDNFDSTLTITFPNKHDGIQLHKEDLKNGSAFKLPRFASLTGYKQKLTRMRRGELGKPVESDFEEDNNYIFRVRSEEKDGKLVRALYGKIQGDIQIASRGRKTASILLTYYLNPDYTRNLEYDPSRNLFQNLRSTERVGL